MNPHWLLVAVYAGTGMTALAYEILWMRMLSLMYGISSFGVVFTVTAFMAGLGLGSLLGTRSAVRFSARRGLSTLALIEGGLALYAMILPLLLPRLDSFLLHLGAGLPLGSWHALQGAGVLLLLLPAALLMGLAFPMALAGARAFRIDVGIMYGSNALGGAVGAWLPLWLLPALGWRHSLWLTAAVGLFLSFSAWFLSREADTRAEDRHEHGGGASAVRPPVPDLLAYALIGASALMFEVLWSRLFGTLLLRTEYVLAVLLFVYLAGIGLGGVLGRRLQAPFWFKSFPLLIATAAIASLYALPLLGQWIAATSFPSFPIALMTQALAITGCTLPVTLLLGAWLPMLNRRFSGGDPSGGGWWYGANSIGGAVGAMLAGFALIPVLGSPMALILAAVLVFAAGMRWAHEPRLWMFLPALLLLAWPVMHWPPVADLLPRLKDVKDLSVYEDAIALTHVVERADGQRLLLSDLQRMDASSDPLAVVVQKNQSRLPLLLHPGAESILFLGLGTGITASGSLAFPGLRKRVSVELSQGAILAAGTYFRPVNAGILDQMQIIVDDGRRFLRTGMETYDVIVGDLFHPDMAGRANLLSLQQFRRVRARLTDHGVFVQWLALNQFDVRSLKVILATFLKAFGSGHAVVFIDGYRLAMVGFKGPPSTVARLMRQHALLEGDAGGHEGLWTWLGRCWGEIPGKWLQEVPLQDEWSPVIEYALPRVRYEGGVDMIAMWGWLLQWRASDEAVLRFWHADASHRPPLVRARAGSALDVRMWLAELQGDEHKAVAYARLAKRANGKDRWPSILLADRMFASLRYGLPSGLTRRQALMKILDVYPWHEGALREMWLLSQEDGHVSEARRWHDRLAAVAPLTIDVRSGLH